MSLAFLFPGQGSQSVGMGADLFERFPDLLKEADELLGYSIRSLCLEDPDAKLGRTEYTQPALYLVSYLQALSLRFTFCVIFNLKFTIVHKSSFMASPISTIGNI